MRPLTIRRLCGLAFCIFFATVSHAQDKVKEPAVEAQTQASEQAAEDLIKRVKARWDALIDTDYKNAYQFETPAYRKVYNWKQFRARFGTTVSWEKVRIKRVELNENLENDPVAKVTVVISYIALVGDSETMRGNRPVYEKWIKVGAEWFHLQD